MKFKNSKEMYDFLSSGKDLYSKSLGVYVFEYNDAHALCIYNLKPEEVVELVKKSKESKEYWGAHLGWGGSILDSSEYNDDEHRYSEDEAKRNLQPSLDFCEETYMVEDWQDVDWINDNAAILLKDNSLILVKNLSTKEFKKLKLGDKILAIYNTLYAEECEVTGPVFYNGDVMKYAAETDKGYADESCVKVFLSEF